MHVMYGEESVIPELKILQYPDPCSENKTLIVVLDAGEITEEDNFFGFDYELTYSRNLLAYNGVLKNNTFAEIFDNRLGFSSSVIEDTLYGGGGSASNPVFGDKYLVGFSFEYLGNPDDKIDITINYIDMYSGFNRVVKNELSINIDEIIQPLSYKQVILLSNDTLHFDENLSASYNIDLNNSIGSRLDSFAFKLTFPDEVEIEEYLIDSTLSINIYESNKQLDVSVSNINDFNGNFFTVLLKQLNQDEDYFNLTLFDLTHNDSSCINRIENNNTIIKTRSVTNVQNIVKRIQKIEYYDILGNKIKSHYEDQIRHNYKMCIKMVFYSDGSIENKYLIN